MNWAEDSLGIRPIVSVHGFDGISPSRKVSSAGRGVRIILWSSKSSSPLPVKSSTWRVLMLKNKLFMVKSRLISYTPHTLSMTRSSHSADIKFSTPIVFNISKSQQGDSTADVEQADLC